MRKRQKVENFDLFWNELVSLRGSAQKRPEIQVDIRFDEQIKWNHQLLLFVWRTLELTVLNKMNTLKNNGFYNSYV